MTVQRLARARRAIAGSRRAAAIYFTAVLAALAIASTWTSGNAIAFAGVFAFALPVPSRGR